MLKGVLTYSPLIGSYIIFLGIFKLILFYWQFDIDIIDYLSFTEILTSFLDDLNILLLFAIIYFVHFFTIFFFMEKDNSHEDNIEVEEEYIDQEGTVMEEENKLVEYLKPKMFYYQIPFLIISIICFIYFRNYLALYFVALYVYQFIGTLLLKIASYLSKYEGIDEFLFGTFTFIFPCFLVLGSVFIQTKSVLINPREYTITFKNESVYKTNVFNIYLGKTDKYIFIYNTANNSHKVMPCDEIKEIYAN